MMARGTLTWKCYNKGTEATKPEGKTEDREALTTDFTDLTDPET
jgi:hypothetical protein